MSEPTSEETTKPPAPPTPVGLVWTLPGSREFRATVPSDLTEREAAFMLEVLGHFFRIQYAEDD